MITDKLWSLEYADAKFSAWIRKRDGKCMYPYCWRKEALDCSHFILRHNKATRFDPDNAIALCRIHHQELENPAPHKNPVYRALMFTILGAERLAALEMRGNSIYKEERAIRDCMALCSSNT